MIGAPDGETDANTGGEKKCPERRKPAGIDTRKRGGNSAKRDELNDATPRKCIALGPVHEEREIQKGGKTDCCDRAQRDYHR